MANRFYELPFHSNGDLILFGRKIRPASATSKEIRIGERELVSWSAPPVPGAFGSHSDLYPVIERFGGSHCAPARLFLLVIREHGLPAGREELYWLTVEEGVRRLFQHHRLHALYQDFDVEIEWAGIDTLGERPVHPDDSYVETPLGSWMDGQRAYSIHPARRSGEPAFLLIVTHHDQRLAHHLELPQGIELLEQHGFLDHIWE